MPVVITEGRFNFVVYEGERPIEPSRVHVFEGDVDVRRINLESGTFMGPVYPPQEEGSAILQEYRKYAVLYPRGLRRWQDKHSPLS